SDPQTAHEIPPDMTDPLDNNDDWAELAREFALDKPPVPVNEDRTEPAPEAAEAAPEEVEPEDDFEDAEEAAPGDGEPGSEGDGIAGTGRKRRRRRRRRRKGAPGDTVAVPALARESNEDPEAQEEDAEPDLPTEEAEAPARDEGEYADDFDSEPAPMSAEEDTANDVLRELIATWNVPSWDSIVSGLYRPN
ncbi:MAG TPA: hypothetical protein VGE74_27755, partial [Gemmata sp.]